MTRRTLIFCVALLGFTLAGCQSNNDFQKKWPQFPQWGWWKHPAKDVPEPTAEEPAADEFQDESRDEIAQADAPLPEETKESRGPSTLEEHRADVWETVVVLRDVEELPPDQQRKLIESARRNLRKWYRPMAAEPPDPNDPQWITVLVWDFMPEEDFDHAAEHWRQVARQERFAFPENVSRRELMEFVEKVTGGELQPAGKTKPETPPAGGKPAPAVNPKDKGTEQ
jgi:hypothetical protein